MSNPPVVEQAPPPSTPEAMLALAVWAKLFPVVVLPVVLAVRMAQGRVRAAAVIAGAPRW
jgi:hypothetical protein